MAVRPSLQRKLVVLVAAAIGTATVGSTLIALWQQAVNYADLRHQALVTTAQVFAAAAAPSTAAENRDGAFTALRGMAQVRDISYAEIRTNAGKALAGFGAVARLADDLTLVGDEKVSLSNMLRTGSIEISVPIINEGTEVGRFVLVGGIADLRPKLMVTATFTMAGAALALVIGLMVAWRLQRRITKPLRDLLLAMVQVRQDQQHDVTVGQASDREIGELVDGFNRMRDDVRERDRRLEAHARNLESEVIERTKELRVARDAAESANRAKSDFLATMSHEIRTPMNGIMVMAELLTQAKLPRRQQRFADVISNSGKSLLAIINDILDFSKIEAGKLQLEQLPVDVNALVENVTSLFAERAREKKIDLAALVDPSVPRSIMSDPVRLGQIIGNLVNNALKFTETGFVKLTVTTEQQRGRLVLGVTDTGIGIAEDKLGTIFESFSQADQTTTRNFGGTGLGLTISRQLVRALGGEITVTSRPGEGSCFSLSLPIGETEKPSWPRLTLGGSEIAFCVLDIDGEATRSAITRYFSAAGYTVLERDQGLTPEQCANAAVICADVARIDPYLTFSGETRPRLVAVCALGDAAGELAGESRKIDACLTRPLLRSEIEDLLRRLASGERVLRAIAAPSPRSATARLRPFRALVADDNAVNREVAAEALSQLGAGVSTVENGLQAVEAVAKNAFDIVFMDGSMPEMDGFEAARRIREAEEGGPRRTPIVALTAHVVGASADAWRDAGMDDVVHKPFTVAKLAQTIGKLLPHLVIEGDSSDLDRGDSADLPGAVDPETAEQASFDAAVLAQLRELQANGQPGFVRRVFGLYLEHAPVAADQIRLAVANEDIAGCARAAHSLKSMSYNIGAAGIAALAHELENCAKVLMRIPDQPSLARLLEALRSTLKDISALPEFAGDAAAPGDGNTPLPAVPNQVETIEDALARAIERRELFVEYQPIVDRTAARTSAVEALLRWRWKGETVSPAVFIPLAEKTGVIHELGEWVLRQACLDALAWPNVDLSVNVSAVQFAAPDLASRVARVVAEVGFDWKRLHLEITETALLSAEEAVLNVMTSLRREGASFALDDFGTGYSSLTYLRRFPFDRIKIDRSFVADVSLIVNATIVHAITSIGRSLGLKVVAEGVETAEQQRFLTAAGVHFLQGYRFGHPMSPEAMAERLQSERDTLKLTAGG